MNLKTWYGGSIRIPNFSSDRYPTFAASCMGIVNSMMNRYLAPIQINFNNVESASADRPNGIININANYLYGNILEQKLNEDQTLTIINGLILHEAGHFSDSPDDLTVFIDYIKKHTTCVFNEEMAARIGNIVEDIWIEAEIERKVPSLHWMLEGMNEFFFSLQSLERVYDSVSLQETAPSNMVEVVNVTNMLLVAKIFKRISSTLYVENLFNLIRTATSSRLIDERLNLTLAIYDNLMKDITQEQCDDANKKLMEDLKRLVEGLTSPHDGEKGMVYIEREIKGDVDKINEIVNRLGSCEITLIPDNPVDGLNPTTLFIEETPALSTTAVSADSRYQRLAEVARQRAVVNRPYGEDRQRGTHIRKLHRIATDSKIFAEPLNLRLLKPMQVMIVVDCSGSMSGERIQKAKTAALGAANGLAEARCEVGVFGHTADLLGGTEVFIYRFKDFNEPISILPYRLVDFRMKQNRDSYAISYLSKKMRNTRLRRLMVVISDGAPAAAGYGGQSANLHTRQMVEQIRKEGIDVLSISITQSASQTNDYIYGKENNIYNEDPNIIEKIVRKLVEG